MKDELAGLGSLPSVLLVEDEITSRQALAEILSRRGFKVHTARSAVEGVNKARRETNQVVLMDIHMPGLYDGVDAAKMILQENPEASVIFVSAYASDREYRQRIEESGLNALGFFEKPLLREHLASLGALITEAVSNREKKASAEEEGKAIGIIASPLEGQTVVVLNSIDLLLYKQLQIHPELIKALDWRVFEKLLADILESFGYNVDLMRGTKDGGIDIIAIGKPEPWGEHRYLLQAKRWAKRVGVEPVRELKFLHDHMRATRSCLATTSTFTKGAWCLAREYPWQLELRDYIGIREWIDETIELKQGKRLGA